MGYSVVEGLGGGERGRREGGGYSAKNRKPSRWGSVSVDETREVLDFGRGDGNGAGYTAFEGLGGGERARREGGGNLAENQKLSHRSSVWLVACGGGLGCVGEIRWGWGNVRLRWWERAIEQRTRVGWIWAPHQKPSRQCSVLANETRGVAQMTQGTWPEVTDRGVEVVEEHDRPVRKGVGW